MHNLLKVKQVKKGDLFSMKTKSVIRRNDKLYKIIYTEEEDLMA